MDAFLSSFSVGANRFVPFNDLIDYDPHNLLGNSNFKAIFMCQLPNSFDLAAFSRCIDSSKVMLAFIYADLISNLEALSEK